MSSRAWQIARRSLRLGEVYYAGGCFYVQQPQGGFAVVPAPAGVIVNVLPSGAVPVTINGVLYYEGDGTYFLPVENGVTAYETVQP